MFQTFILFLAATLRVSAQQTWSALGNGLSGGTVEALQVMGGVLYAGGNFMSPGNYDIAQWNGTAWVDVGTGGPQFTTVRALAGLSGNLYAAGALGGVLKWDGTAWSNIGGTSFNLYALATRGANLYAGGDFGTFGTILYYDTTLNQWNSLGSLPDNVIVYAIAITGDGTIYVGGSLGTAAVLYKWNPITLRWDPVANGPTGGPSVVRALTVYGNDLYVGGRFTTVGSPGIAVRGLAKWSASTWSAVGAGTPPWKPCNDPDPSTVRAIAWNGSGQMYVTGYLANEGSSQINHIFLLQDGQWSSTVPTQGISRNTGSGDVGRALAVDRFAGKVYVGGWFQTAGTVSVANVALWTDFRPYTLSDMGTLSGGTLSYGLAWYTGDYGGRPIGYAQTDVPGSGLRNHACYYLGGPYGLIDMGGMWSDSDNTYAYAGNNSGTIVGSADYAGSGTLIRAFRWARDVFTQLNTLPGGDRASAQAINDNGDTVGFSRNSSGVDRATRWPSGSTTGSDMQTLVTPDSASYASYGYSINKDGFVVGKARYNSANSYFHAYRCPSTRAIIPSDDLGTMNGGSESIAFAINDSRQIVGSSLNGSGIWRAFIKAPDSGTGTGFTDLGDGYSNGLNNAGDVVGGVTVEGFIWTSASGRKRLIDLVPAGTAWTLNSGTAITDTGVIVGWGYKSVGQGYETHGFRLDP